MGLGLGDRWQDKGSRGISVVSCSEFSLVGRGVVEGAWQCSSAEPCDISFDRVWVIPHANSNSCHGCSSDRLVTFTVIYY